MYHLREVRTLIEEVKHEAMSNKVPDSQTVHKMCLALEGLTRAVESLAIQIEDQKRTSKNT